MVQPSCTEEIKKLNEIINMKLTTKLSFLLILFNATIFLSQSNKALKPINETISFEENKGQMKDQFWK